MSENKNPNPGKNPNQIVRPIQDPEHETESEKRGTQHQSAEYPKEISSDLSHVGFVVLD